jgi:ankyrin repeat protein
MVAADHGHLAAVTELLKAGASREEALPDGRTVLALAESQGHAAIVQLLSV